MCKQNALNAKVFTRKLRMIDMRSDVQKERLELQTILDRPGFNETAFVDRGKKWQHARTNLEAERMKLGFA
jgi:hypothetical protein